MISNQETLNLSPYMAIYDIVVPKDNMLRQINELVDFSFILEELKTKYCLDNGRNANAYTPIGRKNSKMLIGSTKTYDSVRTIAIPDRLVSALREFKKYQSECKLKLGAKYDKTFDFIFTTTGKPLTKSTFKNALDRILRKAELHPISIHGLRHSHAVLLLETGVEMKYIQERLGHKSIEITADIYSHVTPKIIENEQSNVGQ